MAEFTEEELDKVVEDVHNDAVTTKQLQASSTTNIYNKTSNSLIRTLLLGWGVSRISQILDKDDRLLVKALANNIYRFSAAKTYQLVRDMRNFLFDSKGLRKTLEVFKVKADVINGLYNKTWLEVETQLTRRQADSAAEWVDVIRTQETFPLLKYRTIGDDQVRDKHKSLDGVVRPVNDRFWSRNYPPNGYRCRCRAIQIQEGEEAITPITEAKNVAIEEQDPLFNFNPAKEEVIFRASHPYFHVAPKNQGQKEDNFGFDIPDILPAEFQ